MVRVFRGFINRKKAYYAVTGTGDFLEAVREVAKYKKASYSKMIFQTNCKYGTIAPYGKVMDGLWFAKDKMQGEPCVIVWKE